MKILKLAKNKIYLEDEIIDVSKDIIYTYSLTVDMDITNIYYQLIFESMKYKALYILGLKSRTEFELKNKLKEKYSKKHFNIIDDVIKKLKDMYLIDDYEYTTSYVKYNMNKGRNKVKKYLLSKGVSVNMIDEVFSEFSEEIYIEEKKKIYSNFNVIRLPKNQGQSIALNEGLKNCTYNLVARMDADDISRKDRFQKEVDFLDRHPNVAVVGSYQHHFGVDIDWIHKPATEPAQCKCNAVFFCDLCHSTLMLRKSIFIENDLYYDFYYYRRKV